MCQQFLTNQRETNTQEVRKQQRNTPPSYARRGQVGRLQCKSCRDLTAERKQTSSIPIPLNGPHVVDNVRSELEALGLFHIVHDTAVKVVGQKLWQTIKSLLADGDDTHLPDKEKRGGTEMLQWDDPHWAPKRRRNNQGC